MKPRPKTKLVQLLVTVRVPERLSAQHVPREVRTLINEGCAYGAMFGPNPWESVDVGDIKVASVKPVPKT